MNAILDNIGGCGQESIWFQEYKDTQKECNCDSCDECNCNPEDCECSCHTKKESE